MPENAKEIQFTYRLKTKVLVDESGVYADSLFFRMNFPAVKFIKVNQPKENHLNACIQLQSLKKVDKEKLEGILYHANEVYTATYSIKNDQTNIAASRNDAELKVVFNKYFQTNYKTFKYNEKLDYKKRVKRIVYPNISYQPKFDEIEKSISWISETEGTFNEIVGNSNIANVIVVDRNLAKVISLGHIFENCEFGVISIESVANKLELIAVTYK
jgi:hypothetical protein